MRVVANLGRRTRWLVAGCLLITGASVGVAAERSATASPPRGPARPPARASSNRDGIESPVPLTSNLDPNFQPIDLNTALRLAGVQNPELILARQRVVEAVALRQLAAVQILPTINLGTNYDTHTGVLQQSNGNILSVNRTALYLGAGANAVAAGTVNVPGLVLYGNVSEGVFAYLIARQFVNERGFASEAVRNQALLAVTLAYSELLRAEGQRAVALQVRDEADEVYRLVAAYSKAGQAKKADADRAATELARRQANVQQADGEVQVASARLAEVLNIDPSVRLHPTDASVVPAPLVPDPIPVCELIALALLRRPELSERRVVILEALLALQGAKVLPFSPTIFLGGSSGAFGGGSNLVRPVFGGFGGRTDVDVVAYWSLQNLGIGNLAMINLARARLQVSQYQELAVLDQVREEVAEAYAKTHARFAQIATNEQAVRSSTDGYREDLARSKGAVGLPIELLNSLRLLAAARSAYLDAIVDYNRAQFELYVALGQPPADMLARPVPTAGVVPAGQPAPKPPSPPAAGVNGAFTPPKPRTVGR